MLGTCGDWKSVGQLAVTLIPGEWPLKWNTCECLDGCCVLFLCISLANVVYLTLQKKVLSRRTDQRKATIRGPVICSRESCDHIQWWVQPIPCLSWCLVYVWLRVATSALWKKGRGNEGTSTETPKASRGVGKWGGDTPGPLVRWLGASGSVVGSPSRVLGQSPTKFWFLGYFLCQKHDVYAAIYHVFLN